MPWSHGEQLKAGPLLMAQIGHVSPTRPFHLAWFGLRPLFAVATGRVPELTEIDCQAKRCRSEPTCRIGERASGWQLSGRDVWHHPVHRGPCCSSWSGTLAVIHTGASVIVSLKDGMMLACSFVRDERKRQYEDKQDWQPSQAESSTARLLDFDGASRVACKKNLSQRAHTI